MTNEQNQNSKQAMAQSMKKGYSSSIPLTSSNRELRETDVLKKQITRDLKDFAGATSQLAAKTPVIGEVVALFGEVKNSILAFVNGIKRSWEFTKTFAAFIGKSFGVSRNRTMAEVQQEKAQREREGMRSRKTDELMSEFAKEAITPGSIYVHDVHLEPLQTASLERIESVDRSLTGILSVVSAIKKALAIVAFIRLVSTIATNLKKEEKDAPLIDRFIRAFKRADVSTLERINGELQQVNAKLDELILINRSSLTDAQQRELERLQERRLDLIRQREAEEEAGAGAGKDGYEKDVSVLKEKTSSLFGESGGIRGIIGKLKEYLLIAGGALLANLKGILKTLWKYTKPIVEPIFNFVKSVFKGISKIFITTFKAIYNIIKFGFNVIVKTFKGTFKFVTNLVVGIGKSIRWIFGALFGKKGVFAFVFRIFKNIEVALSGIGTNSKAITSVLSKFGGFAKFLSGIGKFFIPLTIVMTAYEVITNMVKGYKEGGLIGAFKGALQGLWEGILGNLLNFAKDVVAWILDALGFKNIAKKLKEFDFNKFYNDLMNKAFEIWGNILGWIGKKLGAVGNWISGVWKGLKGTSQQDPNIDDSTKEPKQVKAREDRKLFLAKKSNSILDVISSGIGDMVWEMKNFVQSTSSKEGLTAATDILGKIVPGMGTVEFKDTQGRVTQKRSGGDRNWRNNNPGNIRYGEFAAAHGAIGSDGAFAIFPNMKMGYAAADALLSSKNYKGKSIREAIQRWAPSNENDTASYIAAFKKAGFDVSKPYSSLSKDEKGRFLEVMYKREGGRAGRILPGSVPLPDVYAGGDPNQKNVLNNIQNKQNNIDDAKAKQGKTPVSVIMPAGGGNVTTNTSTSSTTVVATKPPYRNTLDDYRLQTLNGDLQFLA
jgi:hypothetical protein